MGLLSFFLIAGALCGGFQENNSSKKRNGWRSDERLDYYQYRKQHGYE